MTTKNPFAPAAKVSKRLKVLIYGASGVGKTLAALSFPRPAVIDTEGGTDLYAARTGIPEFAVMKAKALEDVEKALEFIKVDNGAHFDTLIIDPITVLYDVQKEAAGDKAKVKGEMTPREWGRVNKRMVNLYNTLTSLPVHVVVIARETDLMEGEGLNLKRVGFKADMDKKGVYIFDFIVRMKTDRSGEVIKSRGVNLGKTMETVNFGAFAKAADLFTDGAPVTVVSDDKAAETDAKAYEDLVAKTSAAPSWWSVLGEYRPFMEEKQFHSMRETLSMKVKDKVVSIPDMAGARDYIDSYYAGVIDMDALRAARKEVEMPS